MARSDRRQEQHVLRLLGQARQEVQSGQALRALRPQQEAIELARALFKRHPDDPRHPLSIASALYGLAGMLTSASRPADAVGALDESEQLYRSIDGLPGMPDAAPLIADIAARRALALAADGRGASAVPEAETAVAFYQLLASADESGSLQRDLARVYAGNAKVLARFGDPDMAVASADRAIRIYLSSRDTAATSFQIERDDLGYLVVAASIAATIHAWHGRIEVSLVAALLVLQFAGDSALHESLRAVSARVDKMTPARRAEFGQEVAAALRLAGVGRPPGESGADHDALTVVKAIGALRLTAGYATAPPGPDSTELITLADALARASDEPLSTELVRPPLDCAIAIPADRCGAQTAPAHALNLAELAIAVLPAAPADGIRIGLEAHYLFALASRRRVTAMRYQLSDFGPAWARVLLACSAAFEQAGDAQMALDLASWAAGTARELAPFMLIDPGLTPLVRQCIERHGQMLIATGDRQDGEAALATARSLGPESEPGPGRE